jgi:hypothetical protein
MAIDIGTGTTVTVGGSAFSMNLTNVQVSGVERPAIKTSHLGTTSNHSFVPGDMINPGEIVLEGFYDPDATAIPITGAASAIVIDFNGTKTYQVSGFCIGFDVTAPLEDMITYTARFKCSGVIAIAV